MLSYESNQYVWMFSSSVVYEVMRNSCSLFSVALGALVDMKAWSGRVNQVDKINVER